MSSGLYLTVKYHPYDSDLRNIKNYFFSMEKKITSDSLLQIALKEFNERSELYVDSFFNLIHVKSGNFFNSFKFFFFIFIFLKKK